MNFPALTKLLLLLLVPAVLAFGADPADAQRRNKKQQEEKQEAMFPNATREEPGLRAHQRFAKDLTRMYEASQEGDHARVLELADKVIAHAKAGPYERAVSQQNAAFVLMEQDRYEEAAQRIELAIGENALNNDTHYQLMLQLAQIRMQDERYEEALPWLERLMEETRSDRADFRMLKANALFRLDRFQEAADTARAVIEATAEPDPNWVNLLMACYFEMEQPLEAAKIAEAQLAKNPSNKQMLMNLASIYVDAERYDDAAATLAKARSLGLLTDDRDYRQLYRLYLNIDGREADAVEVINEGLEKGILQPGHEVYTILGQAYYFSDKISEAITAWTEADKFAEDGEVALNLARVLYNEERYPAAIEAAKRALDKGVKRPGEAWIVIGNAEYFGNDSRSAGIAAYREAAKYPETKEQAETWLRQSRNM